MGDIFEPFIAKLLTEIEESQKIVGSVFELAKKGSTINTELLEKKGGTKQDLARIIIKFLTQTQKNSTMMRRAVSEIEKRREEARNGNIELMKLQKVLLDCQSAQINTFQQSFDVQLKSYSDALMDNVKEQAVSDSNPTENKSLIKTVVKSAIEEMKETKYAELDRSKSLVLFGLEEPEDTNDDTQNVVQRLLENIGFEDKQPIVRRLGTKNSEKTRPVRVTLKSSSEVQEILKKKKNLKFTDFSHVYMAPDRTPDEQKEHARLVKKLKDKIKNMPNKRFYIKNGEIRCDENANKVDDDDYYYLFDTVNREVDVVRFKRNTVWLKEFTTEEPVGESIHEKFTSEEPFEGPTHEKYV